jgi:hypothetical protein
MKKGSGNGHLSLWEVYEGKLERGLLYWGF